MKRKRTIQSMISDAEGASYRLMNSGRFGNPTRASDYFLKVNEAIHLAQRLHEALSSLAFAVENDTGAEPSVSMLAVRLDEAKHLLETTERKSA